MSKSKRDYLAIIFFATGSSYARGPDKEDTINRVLRIFKSDWKTLFDLPKGREISVAVYDVTGHDKVWWDHAYKVRAEGNEDEIPMLEAVKRPLP